MKLLLRCLPYLIIIALSISIYFGFKYMTNKLSESKQIEQTLNIENKMLQEKMKASEELTQITIKQLEKMQSNEKEAITKINDSDVKINSLHLEKINDSLLQKINEHEDCVANNFKKPLIKCEINLK